MFIYQVVRVATQGNHKVLCKYTKLADAEAHVDSLIDNGDGFLYGIQTEYVKESYNDIR